MVAITHIGFGQNPSYNSQDSDIISHQHSCPLTPTASDCLSVTSDHDGHDSSVVSEMAPVRRDPALLIERLENSISRRRMGKRKMRKALNDAALAALVEGHEEEPSLVMRPYHSAFQQLLQSPTNMMVWYHFTNLSEEDQRLFLEGPKKQRTSVISEPPLSKDEFTSATVASTKPVSGAECVVDGRSLHPAALSPIRRATGDNELWKNETANLLLDPLVSVGTLPMRLDPSQHGPIPSRSAAEGDTGSNSPTGPMVDGGMLPHHMEDPALSPDPKLGRTSSPLRYPAAPLPSDIFQLVAECAKVKLNESQSSNSSFEVIGDSDTDNEVEGFSLLEQ